MTDSTTTPTEVTLHGIHLTQVRAVASGVFVGVPDQKHYPRGVGVYGSPMLSLFRNEHAGFRGHVSNWITRAGRECFKMDVWGDGCKQRVRRLYRSERGAVRALERAGVALLAGG
jgi:hypothetical protein